jgi:hypothetical protein
VSRLEVDRPNQQGQRRQWLATNGRYWNQDQSSILRRRKMQACRVLWVFVVSQIAEIREGAKVVPVQRGAAANYYHWARRSLARPSVYPGLTGGESLSRITRCEVKGGSVPSNIHRHIPNTLSHQLIRRIPRSLYYSQYHLVDTITRPQRIPTMSPVATKQSHPTGSTKKLSSEQVIHLEHEHSAHNYHPLPV